MRVRDWMPWPFHSEVETAWNYPEIYPFSIIDIENTVCESIPNDYIIELHISEAEAKKVMMWVSVVLFNNVNKYSNQYELLKFTWHPHQKFKPVEFDKLVTAILSKAYPTIDKDRLEANKYFEEHWQIEQLNTCAENMEIFNKGINVDNNNFEQEWQHFQESGNLTERF